VRIWRWLPTAALFLMANASARAQLFDALINPDVEVTLAHPPGLGVKVQRVAFAPPQARDDGPLVAACSADLAATRQIEIVDRNLIETSFKDAKFSLSKLQDRQTVTELGKRLGSPMLLFIDAKDQKTTRSPTSAIKPEWRDGQGRIHPAVTTFIARTQVDFSVIVQAVDLATGQAFSPQRIAVSPSQEQSAENHQPEYPPEAEVRQLALDLAKVQVRQLLLPWKETRKLVFYDDRNYGMKEAYQRLELKDYAGALAASKSALALAKVDPKANAKYLGRTQYDVGMCYFMLGDCAAGRPFFQAALESNPNHRIFTMALNECERAIRLNEELARIRELRADAAPPAGP
jgi:hypothetical protein